MSSGIKRFYEFGDFRLDAEKRVLWRAGEIVGLAPKATEVLLLLVENRGNLIEREEILEKVWSDTFVEEGNLNHAISALRKTLGASEIIQTVPRRGYRFTAEVRAVFGDDESDLIVERHTLSHTLIEEHEEVEDQNEKQTLPSAVAAPAATKKTFSSRRNVYPAAFAALLILLLGGAFWFFRTNRAADKFTATKDSPKTLAILPLQSLNNEEEEKSLGLGIAENLAARLGNLEQLVVRPTQSVKTIAETETDPLEIGRKLKTDFVMAGSFQRSGGRIRVTVRLLDAADGSQIWSGSFDETEIDIFKLQDSLSAQVAKSLVERLSPQEQMRLALRPTENVEAYKLYLKGRYFWNQRTVASYFKAIEFFEQSVGLDPNFALGYSGIADCYALLEQRGGLPPEEAFPNAEEAARKALEIDETLAEAHVSIALVKNLYRWEWRETEAHIKRAIELNPNYAPAYGLYGMSLLNQKRFEEAETHLKKAEQIDPTSRSIAIYLAWKFYFARQYDRAIEQSRKALELDNSLTTPYMVLRAAFEQKGMFDEAVEAELKRMKARDSQTLESLKDAYRKSGIEGFRQKQIEVIQKKSDSKSEVADYHIATRYALLGQSEEALREIEKGFVNRGSMWHQINVEPAFDSLRDDLRFQALLRKLHLPG